MDSFECESGAARPTCPASAPFDRRFSSPVRGRAKDARGRFTGLGGGSGDFFGWPDEIVGASSKANGRFTELAGRPIEFAGRPGDFVQRSSGFAGWPGEFDGRSSDVLRTPDGAITTPDSVG